MSQLSFDELLVNDELTNEPPKDTSAPSSPFHNKVKEIVLEGVGSALEICEMLISSGVIPNERYSTGKPISYVKVCRVLDELVGTGLIEFVEDLNKKDRIYHLK